MEMRERPVWPLALRLIHWVLAIAVVLLAVTGWLMDSGLVLNEALYQLLRENLHVPAGQAVGVALAGRLVLLAADPGVSGWRALVPRQGASGPLGQMLRFYLSWGRNRLPGYFAHDPLWVLLYPVLFALLLFVTLAGLAMEYSGMRATLGLDLAILERWHALGAAVIIWLSVLHGLSVLLREVRGKGYEVSAMIHGHRIFRVDSEQTPGVKQEVTIDLSSITTKRSADE